MSLDNVGLQPAIKKPSVFGDLQLTLSGKPLTAPVSASAPAAAEAPAPTGAIVPGGPIISPPPQVVTTTLEPYDTAPAPGTSDAAETTEASKAASAALPAKSAPTKDVYDRIYDDFGRLFEANDIPGPSNGKSIGLIDFLKQEVLKEREIDGVKTTGFIVVDEEFKEKLLDIIGVKEKYVTDEAFEAAFGNQNHGFDKEDRFTIDAFAERIASLAKIFINRSKSQNENFKAFLGKEKVEIMPQGMGKEAQKYLNKKVITKGSINYEYLKLAAQSYAYYVQATRPQDFEQEAKRLQLILEGNDFEGLPDDVWDMFFDSIQSNFESQMRKHDKEYDVNPGFWGRLWKTITFQDKKDNWKEVNPDTNTTLRQDFYSGLLVDFVNNKNKPPAQDITPEYIRATAKAVGVSLNVPKGTKVTPVKTEPATKVAVKI